MIETESCKSEPAVCENLAKMVTRPRVAVQNPRVISEVRSQDTFLSAVIRSAETPTIAVEEQDPWTIRLH